MVPGRDIVLRRAAEVAAQRRHCLKPELDKLVPHSAAAGRDRRATIGRICPADEQHQLLKRIADAASPVKPATSRTGPRRTIRSADLKADVKSLIADAGELANQFVDGMLRPLAHWVGRRVVEAAQERAATGELEFHDLLVIARRVLREDATVRRSLRDQFRHLLLDEFQDTDPIQIELALRIAGGDRSEAGNEVRYDVPAGSLFVVGDPKQSIYRFRRADITRYLQTKERLGRDRHA